MADYQATVQRVKTALKSGGTAEIDIDSEAEGVEDVAKALAFRAANEAHANDPSIEVNDGKLIVTAKTDEEE